MKSEVYLIRVNDNDSLKVIKEKFGHLLQESKVLDFIRQGWKVPIKLHFGEEGNTGFVKPELVRIAVERIKQKKALPVLSDTNTLYRSKRLSTSGHLELAHTHGFREEITGAPLLIADEQKVGSKIANFFLEADALIGIAHFKGHMMTGFGGALKNIGMGCATREGKLAQHSDFSPRVNLKNCTGCEECAKVCPVGAIVIIDKKSHLDSAKCIGCGSCIAACKFEAMDVDWESGAGNIQQKMVEYAKAALKGKEKKSSFINFAIKITKECDCLAKDDPRISPDVGILASKDPVSIDKASFDLVIEACGRDIFKEVHPHRNGLQQLDYAAKIGLGNLNYKLIEI